MYFMLYQDSDGRWRWCYNTSNHMTIAISSESYATKEEALHIIHLVKGCAQSASVYDTLTGQWR
ncbi:MAG: DUF1508 domain-containing protein [Gammaproteobacteria bacterium]